MTRRARIGVALIALIGCGKGAGDSVSLLDEPLVVRHQTVQDVELDITLPKQSGKRMEASPTGAGVTWAGGDRNADVLYLTVEVSLGTPEVFQNAVNAEGQTDRRISRSDQAADGWTLTSANADGKVLSTRRMIQKDRRALYCKAEVQWGKPLHDPARTEWLEAMCRSMTATKFP